MKTITRKIYLYAHGSDYTVTTTDNMEAAGWTLIDSKDISFEFDEAHHVDMLKQNKIDALLAQQERVSAEILELTS